MKPPPFDYCKVKATLFNKEWAKKEYGRGFTKAFLYGKFKGYSLKRNHIKAEWDDGFEMEAQLSKCIPATKAEFTQACKLTKDRKAGAPLFDASYCARLWCTHLFPLSVS